MKINLIVQKVKNIFLIILNVIKLAIQCSVVRLARKSTVIRSVVLIKYSVCFLNRD